MSPHFFLNAVEGGRPAEVTFAKQGSQMSTGGVAVFEDRPQEDSLEIQAMFGPGMGDKLFAQAEERARRAGRHRLVANVVPGARDLYRARGFESTGPQGSDGAYPMSKDVLGSHCSDGRRDGPMESSRATMSQMARRAGPMESSGATMSQMDPFMTIRSPPNTCDLGSPSSPEPKVKESRDDCSQMFKKVILCNCFRD